MAKSDIRELLKDLEIDKSESSMKIFDEHWNDGVCKINGAKWEMKHVIRAARCEYRSGGQVLTANRNQLCFRAVKDDLDPNDPEGLCEMWLESEAL